MSFAFTILFSLCFQSHVHNSILQMQSAKVLIFTESMACLYKIWNEVSGWGLVLQMERCAFCWVSVLWWVVVAEADVVARWYKLCSLWSPFRVFTLSCPSVAIAHWHLLHQKVWSGQNTPALSLEQNFNLCVILLISLFFQVEHYRQNIQPWSFFP